MSIPQGRSHAAAAAVFAAATLAMLGDVLLAGNRLVLSMPNEDMTRPFFYWFPFAFGELRQGHLVLWNPYNYAGAAYFGGFGPALLYPPNWLHMVLPTAVAVNVGVALHLFLAGLGVYCWTMHRRLHPAACILAGLVFMFGGAVFLQLYRGHLHCLTTLVWTPLVLLAIDGIVDGGSRVLPWLLLGMSAVALQIFAGHVQYIYYTAIVAGLYGLACWVAFSRRPRTAAALLAIYPAGACLAAVQLFTGLQAATESFRAGISYDVAASFAFPPENVLTTIMPGFFGDMTATPYWGRWTLTEMSLFMGVAPFLLAACGLGAGDRRATRFSAAIIVVVLVLAFGDYTPLFRALYDHAPGFSNFRGTTKFIYLAALFAVMLVAVGFDRVVHARAPRRLALAALATAGLLVVAAAIVTVDCRTGGGNVWRPLLSHCRFLEDAYGQFVQGRSPASIPACLNVGRSLGVAAATFALGGVLLLATRTRPRLAYALAILGVVEVMTYARATRPTFDPRALPERSAHLRRLLDAHGAGDARIASRDPYSYVAMGARAYDLWGADPTVLGRYARFIALTQGWPVDAIVVTSGLRQLSPLLGMLRLRYLMEIGGDERVILRPTGLRELPRALLVPRWRVFPDSDRVLTAMSETGFDPERLAFLDADPGIVPAAAEQRGQVTVRDLSTEVLEITADVPQPSILVVTDNYSASWKATPLADSDATSYRVVPADYLLRAIPLAAGHHHLRLAYQPSMLPVGAWVTLLTLVASAGAGALVATRARAGRRRDRDAA